MKVKDKKQILLRIDQNLWKDLKSWAIKEESSLNLLIENILQKSIKKKIEQKVLNTKL